MKPERCPRCKSKEIFQIAYGYPGEEMMPASLAGKIAWAAASSIPTIPNGSALKARALGRVTGAGELILEKDIELEQK